MGALAIFAAQILRLTLRKRSRASSRRYSCSAIAAVQQSQLLPQLHSLPLFIGQFLPLFLHAG